MPNRRAERVARRIQQEASQIILYELRDPRIEFVTITRVDISDDLRHARIYFSVLGDEAKRRTAERGLASARGLVRSRIAKSLNLREAPTISFEFDPSIERAIQISKLISEVAAELDDTHDEEAGEEPDGSPEPPEGGAEEQQEEPGG